MTITPPEPATSQPLLDVLQTLASEGAIDYPLVGRAFLTGRGQRILATRRAKDSGHSSLHDARYGEVIDAPRAG